VLDLPDPRGPASRSIGGTPRSTDPASSRRQAGLRALAASAAALLLAAFTAGPEAREALFEADSKSVAAAGMDIVVREVERRPRSSVVEVTVKVRGSSVGGSFFVLCSLRQLAEVRGRYRYIAKVDDRPGRGQMLIGFLHRPDEDLAQVDPGLQGASAAALDLDQFSAMCTTPR
jgi:hypothetical protein